MIVRFSIGCEHTFYYDIMQWDQISTKQLKCHEIYKTLHECLQYEIDICFSLKSKLTKSKMLNSGWIQYRTKNMKTVLDVLGTITRVRRYGQSYTVYANVKKAYYRKTQLNKR